jgi:protein involved in polysaccharide export with SLBB domain
VKPRVSSLALSAGLVLALSASAAGAQSLQGVGPSSTGRATGGGSTTDGATETGSQPSGETQLPAGEFALRKSTLTIGQAGPVDPAKYVLGPGDVLQLELWGRVTRTALFEVSPDGKIFLTGAGPLQVAGRTLAWTQERAAERVAATFRGVQADLRLVRLRTFRVYVAGLVNRQGAADVTPISRASEAVTSAGLASGASRRNIEIRRRSGARLRLDLDSFDLGGSQDLDPLLEDGDVLMVPRGVEFASLRGAFRNPRTFELVTGDSLSTLFRLTGGLLPSASRERALFIRFTSATVRESTWLSVPAIESGAANPVLRDGDALFAFFVSGYHEVHSVEAYGEVVHPGTYPITLGKDRLSDLIRWTDGLRPMANRSSIYLVRTSDDRGPDVEFDRLLRLSRSEMTESEHAAFRTRLAERKNVFRVDYDLISKPGGDVDPLLHPGDIVRVEPLLLTVRVDGEVKRPGLVEYAPRRRWSDYIDLVGGFTDRAALGAVRVSRSGTGQVIKAGSVKDIQPGDFIWVPERHDLDAWALFKDVVTIAAQLSVIVLAIRPR